MQVESLTIRNYRCIGDLKLDGLAPITVLVGRNNTGKSALLEALALASTASAGWHDALGDDLIEPIINRRGGVEYSDMMIKMGEDHAEIRTKGEDTSGIMEIAKEPEFLSDTASLSEAIYRYFDEIAPKLFRSSRFESLSERQTVSIKRRMIEQIDVLKDSVWKYAKTYLIYSEPNRRFEYAVVLRRELWEILRSPTDEMMAFELGLGIPRDEFIRSSPTGKSRTLFLLTPSVQYLKELQRRLARSGELLNLISTLRKKIEYFEDLREVKGNFLVFLKGLQSPVPLEAMGDGFRAELATLAAIAAVKKGIALMEEPETRMHPGYMIPVVDQIARTAASGDLQYFISTHSFDFLELLMQTNIELIKVVRMYRIEDDSGIDYEVLDGEEAKKEIHELKMDLRGV